MLSPRMHIVRTWGSRHGNSGRGTRRVRSRVHAAMRVPNTRLTPLLALLGLGSLLVWPLRGEALEPHRLAQTAVVSARWPVLWASAGGEVRLRLVGARSLRLLARRGGLRIEHAFAQQLFGSGPVFAEYGTWHPESLALRVYETAPSLGWPRFTACVRLTSRRGAFRVEDAREQGTEFGCE